MEASRGWSTIPVSYLKSRSNLSKESDLLVAIALVGVGRWGTNLLRVLSSNKRASVEVIVEADEAARSRVAKDFHPMRLVTTLEELDSSRLDAVMIAAPTSQHSFIASWALEEGLDVFVEKPIATSSVEAQKLVDLARENHCILMVGHTFLYNSGVRKTKSVIESGDLGEVRMLNMRRTNLGPIRTDVGAVFDLAAHDLSIAVYLLGDFPVRVSAFGHSWVTPGIEDAARLVFVFPNGESVLVDVSWLYPQKIREVIAVGSRGMLKFDDLNAERPVEIFDKGLSWDRDSERGSPGLGGTVTRSGDIWSPAVFSEQPLNVECNHFLDCIETRQPPITDGVFGTRIVGALEAALKSMEQGSSFVEISY